MNPSALRTRPGAVRKGQVLMLVSTDRAQLARRIPPVRNHHPRSLQFALVLPMAAELATANITDSACPVRIRQQAADVQVFDADQRQDTHPPACRLVNPVPAHVAEALVKASQPGSRLVPVTAATLLTAPEHENSVGGVGDSISGPSDRPASLLWTKSLSW